MAGKGTDTALERADRNNRPQHPLLSVAEASDLAGVSEETVYGWVAAGELPGVMRVGGRWYVRRLMLETWLEGVSARSSVA